MQSITIPAQSSLRRLLEICCPLIGKSGSKRTQIQKGIQKGHSRVRRLRTRKKIQKKGNAPSMPTGMRTIFWFRSKVFGRFHIRVVHPDRPRMGKLTPFERELSFIFASNHRADIVTSESGIEKTICNWPCITVDKSLTIQEANQRTGDGE